MAAKGQPLVHCLFMPNRASRNIAKNLGPAWLLAAQGLSLALLVLSAPTVLSGLATGLLDVAPATGHWLPGGRIAIAVSAQATPYTPGAFAGCVVVQVEPERMNKYGLPDRNDPSSGSLCPINDGVGGTVVVNLDRASSTLYVQGVAERTIQRQVAVPWGRVLHGQARITAFESSPGNASRSQGSLALAHDADPGAVRGMDLLGAAQAAVYAVALGWLALGGRPRLAVLLLLGASLAALLLSGVDAPRLGLGWMAAGFLLALWTAVVRSLFRRNPASQDSRGKRPPPPPPPAQPDQARPNLPSLDAIGLREDLR